MFRTVETIPDSPGAKKRVGYWKSVAQAAREAQGEWVILDDEYSAVTNHIVKARYSAFSPAGTYEAKTRDSYSTAGSTRRGKVYVRYLGEAPLA